MSDFYYLFTLFCSSAVFTWLLDYLIPFAAICAAMILIGGVFRGKSV